MIDIDFYLDTAKRNRSIKSDAELSRSIGFKSNAVTFFRTRKSFPSDQTMIRIAELAGIDKGQALLDLNIWRTDGETRSAYMSMAAILAQHARHISASILAGLFVLFLSYSPAHACEQTPNRFHAKSTNY